MKKLIFGALASMLFISCNNEAAKEAAAPKDSTASKPAAAEFADAKYAGIGKAGIAALSAGNIDAWMESYADNAVYVWNNGDSLAGKAAIADYWKKRRSEVIDTIYFTNDIWLPIKVNQPQSVEAPGTWVLGWYQTHATYKATGKSMTQWIHADLHFDSNDKIDRVIQYLDRAPIAEAMKK